MADRQHDFVETFQDFIDTIDRTQTDQLTLLLYGPPGTPTG